MDNHDLQIKLLLYFQWGKPLRKASELPEFEGYTRQELIGMKNALLRVGYLYLIPGMRTSGSMYRITQAGRDHLARLQERVTT